ncbi:Unknown protein, partial [Striga hermonthica]
QKGEYERQLKIMKEFVEEEPLFQFDPSGYVQDKAVECEEPLFAHEFTDGDVDEAMGDDKGEVLVEAEGVEGAEVIGAILVVGDGCKTCAPEQREQHIEIVAGGSKVLAIGEDML